MAHADGEDYHRVSGELDGSTSSSQTRYPPANEDSSEGSSGHDFGAEKGGDAAPPPPVGVFDKSLRALRLRVMRQWATTGEWFREQPDL